MTTPDWTAQVQAIVALMMLAVTLFGFIFISRQIKLVERTIQSDTNGKLSEQSIQIMSLILSKPHLYEYFYSSKPLDETDPNRVEVLCLCELMANYSDLIMATLPDLDIKVRGRWRKFIEDTLRTSPALQEFLGKYEAWYSAELLDLKPPAVSAPSDATIVRDNIQARKQP